MPTPKDYESAGLYDPTCATAAERLELLEWLSGQGFGIDDMVAAREIGQLTSLAADRLDEHDRVVSREEAAHRSGLTVDQLDRVMQASGFRAGTDVYTEGELPVLEQFALARALFSESEILHFARVMGSSLARIADAANSLFLVDVEAPMRSERSTELELAQAQLTSIQLLDGLTEAIGALFRLHARAAIQRSRDARRGMGDEELELVTLAVGFVDLVGFTAMTETASTRELLDLLVKFESHAYDVVAAHGGRVVKLIGDEVMFTALDADAAARIALAMFDELGTSRRELAPRGGLAFGRVLAHGGDVYGSVVNLAARVADVAVPWEILVTEEFAADLGDASAGSLEPAGRRQLKGFAQPVALRTLVR